MIYCVEDDKNIRELLTYTLKTVGLDALGFQNAKEFYDALETEIPSLILLDIMMPEKDGLTLLSELKASAKTAQIPIILLTAKSSEFDKVTGLDLGADDYITKPFGMMEMTARVKAVLRRYEKVSQNSSLVCKNVCIDVKRHIVTVNDKEVTLSFKEYELLKLLIENKNMVLTRDALLNKIWGYDYDGENRTVDVHIRTLRAKLGDEIDIIQTIRNVGYKVGD